MTTLARKLMDGAATIGPVVITQTADPAGVATSSNIATYSSVSIGTADSERIVVLLVSAEASGATIDSATIDYGSGATAMTAGPQGLFGQVCARAFYLEAPTGTTATFAVTFGTTLSSAQNHVSVYSVTGGTTTGVTTGSDSTTDMDASDPLTTGSITIPTDGGFIAVAAGAVDTNAKTWANATVDLDVDAGLLRHTTATRTTSGTVTVTCTGTSNNEDGGLSYIIFQPG